MNLKDCDTEASYRYKNVTVCERCRQNGPNEYLKASAPAEESKLACNPPASSCALMSVLPRPEAVSRWSILRPVCPLLGVRAHTNLLTIFTSDSSLILHSSCPPLVMPALCPSSSTPSQTCLRAAATKTLRKRRKIFHMFSLGAGTRLHGVARICACECLLRASCMFSGPNGSSLTAHRYDTVALEASVIYHRLV